MKKLGFGLMRLPVTDPKDQKSIDMDQLRRMVDAFLENGFTYFDTAYMYHDHMSEIAIREALVKRHPRESFTLATKLPIMEIRDEADQERIFAEQLEKCGVEFFDYYLLHNVNERTYETVRRLDSFAFLSRMKAERKIRHIGFSFHDRAEVLDRVLTEHPEVEFVQLQINYLDWDSETVQSRLCYETAVKHGKKVVIMEPVKGGALAALPEKAEELLKAADPGASTASWAIRFAAGLGNVMVVLSGMSDMEQLLDNMDHMADPTPLSDRERDLLAQAAEIINNYTAIPCTACRYCVEGCPMGIDIPKVFALYNQKKRAELLHIWGDRSKEEYAAFVKSSAGASDCVGCRQCERACPQHLDNVRLLEEVARTFEG